MITVSFLLKNRNEILFLTKYRYRVIILVELCNTCIRKLYSLKYNKIYLFGVYKIISCTKWNIYTYILIRMFIYNEKEKKTIQYKIFKTEFHSCNFKQSKQ